MARELDWGDIPEKKISPREIDWGNVKQKSQGNQFLHKIRDALEGGSTGILQSASDIGSNIAQFPSDIYTWATGKPGYQAPHPNLNEFIPNSEIGRKSAKAGEILAPFALSPTLAAEANLGGTLFKGKLLPRLIMDMLGGAAESENRPLGAALGTAAPLAGKAIRYVKETPFTKRGATQKLEKAKELAGAESHDIPMDIDFIRNLEYQMGSKHLAPSKMQLNNLMAEATEGDYPSYFALQSALGDVSRELLHPSQQKGKGILGMIGQYLSPPQTSAAERLTGHQIEQLRKQYIEDAMKHLHKTGKGKIAELETKGREDYSRYKKFVPLRNKAAIGAAGTIPGLAYLSRFLG
jgi:hypothetical protein